MPDANTTATAYVLTYDRINSLNRGREAPEYNAPSVVERLYLNFDGVQGAGEVRSYKDLKTIWPIGEVTDIAQPLTIAWGATDTQGGTIEMGPARPFDGQPGTEKLDYHAFGRWLGVRIEYPGDASFTLSGLDLDMVKGGDR